MGNLEIDLETYVNALAPEDAENVRSLVGVLNTYARDGKLQDEHSLLRIRERVIVAAVGSSVSKALGQKEAYGDIDIAVAQTAQTAHKLQALAEELQARLSWQFMNSDSSKTRISVYDLTDIGGNFDGWRAKFEPQKGKTLDVMVVSGSRFGDAKYGRSAEEWLRAQEEQNLPYVVLFDSATKTKQEAAIPA